MSMDFTAIPTATLFAMMLALGLELRVTDFLRVLRDPRALMIGMAGQLVVLPCVALVLVHLLPLPAPTAFGLLLIAACPGGAISNMLSRYARGDVALSIALTGVSSLLAPLSVPTIVGIGVYLALNGSADLELSVPGMVGGLLLTTALPVVLGMAGLALYPARAARLRGPLLLTATLVLIALIIGLGINTLRLHGDPLGMFSRSLMAVLMLIGAGSGAAALAARAAELPVVQRRTLVLEVGVQNVNLALVVALTILGQSAYLGPVLVYLPVMLLFALAMVLSGKREEAAA